MSRTDNLPSAKLPLAGTEMLEVSVFGAPKKVPVSELPGGGGSGGGVWGTITGDINDQTDLTDYVTGLGYITASSADVLTNKTWNGNVISAIYGGTGWGSYTPGDLLYAFDPNTLAKLPIGSTGDVLTVVAGMPAWAASAGGAFVKLDGTTPLTGDWNAGEHSITIARDGSGNPDGINLFPKSDADAGTTIRESPGLRFKGRVWGGGMSNDYDFIIGTNVINGNRPLYIGTPLFKSILIYNSGAVAINGTVTVTSLFSGSAGMNLQSNGGVIRLYNGSNGVLGGVRIYTAGNITGNTATYSYLNITTNWTAASGAFDGRGLYFNGVVNNSGTATGDFYGILYATTSTSMTGRHIAMQTNYGDIQLNAFGGRTHIGSSVAATAQLQIAASSGAMNTVPLKLTAGTNVSAVEDGAFEYDGTNLFFTIGVTRHTII